MELSIFSLIINIFLLQLFDSFCQLLVLKNNLFDVIIIFPFDNLLSFLTDLLRFSKNVAEFVMVLKRVETRVRSIREF